MPISRQRITTIFISVIVSLSSLSAVSAQTATPGRKFRGVRGQGINRRRSTRVHLSADAVGHVRDLPVLPGARRGAHGPPLRSQLLARRDRHGPARGGAGGQPRWKDTAATGEYTADRIASHRDGSGRQRFTGARRNGHGRRRAERSRDARKRRADRGCVSLLKEETQDE